MARRADTISPMLKATQPTREPTPAPAWVALVSAWLGLLVLLASVAFVFLPGSKKPVAELEHAAPFSLADRFLPIPIYGIAVALFVSIVVLWQMRKVPRPLPERMLMQRVQAWIGLGLALVGAIILYTDVALRGPKRF